MPSTPPAAAAAIAVGEALRRLLLEDGELGIAMKVFEEGSEMPIVVALDRLAQGLGFRCGGGHCRRGDHCRGEERDGAGREAKEFVT